MGRLFLKLYSIIAVAAALYFIGVFNLSTILNSTLERHFSGMVQGTYYLFEKQLNEMPEEQWPDLMRELNQGGGYTVRLIPIQSLKFSSDMMGRLKRGSMVVYEVYSASYCYKRILNSDWVLELPFEQSEYNHNQRLSNSTFNLIEMSLWEQPQKKWQDEVTNLEQHFSFPVVLLEMEQVELPAAQQGKLINGEVVWQADDVGVDFLYRRIKNSPYVIKIGPFYEPLTLSYLQTILLLILAALLAVAVLFWVYPLWRDLKRLGGSAQAFGQGDFDARVPLSQRSVLYRLSETFNGMADRIQCLISSHKELTNAVSHELRTPIARLRFAMEMLQSSSKEVDRERFIASMNADINELDQLVAELLTYARFDRDRPALKFQRQEIKPWLIEIVEQAKVGGDKISIEFDIVGEELKYACFEPRLLARSLANLLQNAKRYAQSKINVSFSSDAGYFQISVDDDGHGVPEADREHIFEAFKRLDASRDRDTGGYGIGLAIVDRISQWHGGDVVVEKSRLGGARFIIRWPESEI